MNKALGFSNEINIQVAFTVFAHMLTNLKIRPVTMKKSNYTQGNQIALNKSPLLCSVCTVRNFYTGHYK